MLSSQKTSHTVQHMMYSFFYSAEPILSRECYYHQLAQSLSSNSMTQDNQKQHSNVLPIDDSKTIPSTSKKRPKESSKSNQRQNFPASKQRRVQMMFLQQNQKIQDQHYMLKILISRRLMLLLPMHLRIFLAFD